MRAPNGTKIVSKKKSKIEKENKNDARGGPKRPQEEPKRVKRAKPNRMTKTGTNQHDAKIVLDPPTGRLAQFAPPAGSQLGAQSGTKIEPQTIKNRSKKSRDKKSNPRRSWTRLGAILGRSWPHLGVNFGHFVLENVLFRAKTLFRR